MILCIYGTSAAPFVASTVDQLCRAFARQRMEMQPLTIEQAVVAGSRNREVEGMYVLPFELPPESPETAPDLLSTLYPSAAIFNSIRAHMLCHDKAAATQRLLERGVAVPETLVTRSAEDAAEFIRANKHAIFRQTRSHGPGNLVVAEDASGAIIAEAHGRRYVLELEASGLERRLAHGVLTCPPPFFLQRLITSSRRDGVLTPARVLRAYVIDGAVLFWTELHRARARRPSDFLLGPANTQPRFLQVVSHAADQAARRAADALGVRYGAVDLIRSEYEGLYVLGATTDGPESMIDRSFKELPSFRAAFDLDAHLAEAIATERRDAAGVRAGRGR